MKIHTRYTLDCNTFYVGWDCASLEFHGDNGETHLEVKLPRDSIKSLYKILGERIAREEKDKLEELLKKQQEKQAQDD